jgi:hypothetical protein
MASHVEKYKLEPFAHMLDAGGATAAAYHVPRHGNFQLVVIDGAGKIAYSAGSEISYMHHPTVHIERIERSLKAYPDGILGGVAVPPAMAQAAHLFDMQQFGLMEQELARVLKDSASVEHTRFADTLRTRVAEQRRALARHIQAMAGEQPVQAYREALIFAEAFPKAEDADAVRALAAKLFANSNVKQEIDAEAEYQRVLAPELNKAATLADLNMLKPLVEKYMNTFGKTDYGIVVKNAIADKTFIVDTEARTATPPPKDRSTRGGL